MGSGGLEPKMLANFLPNVIQRGRVLYYGVPGDHGAKIGNLSEQKIQVGIFLSGSKSLCLRYRRAIIRKASSRVGGGLFLPCGL